MASKSSKIDAKLYGEWSRIIRKSVREMVCPACQQQTQAHEGDSKIDVPLYLCRCDKI